MTDSESRELQVLEDDLKVVLQNRKDDYEYSREILYSAAERLQDILESAVVLAQESEHPRSMEVATNTATALADISQKMMEHHQRLDKLNNPGGDRQQVTNQNLNVRLNTKDLLELLNKD